MEEARALAAARMQAESAQREEPAPARMLAGRRARNGVRTRLPPATPTPPADDASARPAPVPAPAATARRARSAAAASTTPQAGTEAAGGNIAAGATPTAGDDLAPPSGTDEVDALLARLRVGNIAFNAPRSINIRDTVRVRALVSPDQAAAVLKAQVDAPGEQVVAPLQVSKLMEARLAGEGFRIEPITSARQAVGSGVTTWEWDVTPEAEGRHRLTLTVDAFVRMDGESVPKTLRTFDHPIEVQVTATQRIGGWLEEHGKWAWSTLLVPLWAWWKSRRKKPAAADNG